MFHNALPCPILSACTYVYIMWLIILASSRAIDPLRLVILDAAACVESVSLAADAQELYGDLSLTGLQAQEQACPRNS